MQSLPWQIFRPFVYAACSSQIPQLPWGMAPFGYNLPFVKCFAARSPFLLHWIARALLEIPGFVCGICMDILAVIAEFNCSPVWVNMKCVLSSVCLQTPLGSVGECAFWLSVQARASTHTHRRKVGFRNCFLAVLPSHKACILPLRCFLRSVSLLFLWGKREIFIAIVKRSVPEQCNLLSKQVSYSPCCNPRLWIAPSLVSPVSLCPETVVVLATVVSCGSTALGFCPLLSWQSSYRNVVSWLLPFCQMLIPLTSREKKNRVELETLSVALCKPYLFQKSGFHLGIWGRKVKG